jgi:hypothetical protein
MLIRLGRLECYIGRQPHWPRKWRARRTSDGYDLRAGRWFVLTERVPKRKPYAEMLAELLAEAPPEADPEAPPAVKPEGAT